MHDEEHILAHRIVDWLTSKEQPLCHNCRTPLTLNLVEQSKMVRTIEDFIRDWVGND